MDFEQLERDIGYVFKNKNLLRQAFTLSSYSQTTEKNNEKLECLGDAILEFIITEKLYFECANEKQMTTRRADVVKDATLEKVSNRLRLCELFIKDKGDTNNKKAVPSAYEALIAAIYIDGGMPAAKKFVLNTADFNAAKKQDNYKGELQEYLQGKGFPAPTYPECENLGTAQKPKFETQICVFDKIFKGSGASKRLAEMQAAKNALEYIKSTF